MKFSAQEEFGLRCMLTIAQEESGFMTIPAISEVEGMSVSHAAKIMAILRKSGYVKSTRGQQGGYELAKHPSEIILKDLMASLGGRLYGEGFCDRHAGMFEHCVHEGTDCMLRPLWNAIQESVDAFTGATSLQDVLNRKVGSTCSNGSATIQLSSSSAPNRG